MQFKCHHQAEKVAPITQPEFKVFLQKNVGEFKLFINNIWKKIKKNS